MPDDYDPDHLFWAGSKTITDLFARVDADLWAEEGIYHSLKRSEEADPDGVQLYQVLREDSKKRERLLIIIKDRLVEARPSLVIEAWQGLLSGGTASRKEEVSD